MEVRKAHARMGQGVQVRRGHLAAKSAQVGKAPVVGDQHDDIGSLARLGGHDGAGGRCVCGRRA